MKAFWIMSLLVLLSSLSMSEETKDYTLNKSVITASGSIQDLKDAPASISVITQEQLLSRPIKDIGEAVSLIPGISIDAGQGQTGSYGISIRGMPSNYTLVLIDGKRQDVSQGAFPNGTSGWASSSFMPPISMIERIEVIRGPMSTLYGSDAMGGIINIITKKNLTEWGASFELQSTFEEQKIFGNIYQGNFYTSGPLDKAKKWSISFRGREQFRSFVPYKNLTLPQDPTQYISATGSLETNNYNIGGRLAYKPDEKNYFYIDGIWDDQLLNNTRPDLFGPTADRIKRGNFILAHLGNYSFGKTDTSIQYNHTSSTGRPISNKDPTDRQLGGDDVIADSKLVMNLGSSRLTLGGQYWFTSLRDKIMPGSTFIYQHNASLFAENELAILDNLFLTLGFRENFNSAFGFNTSPRAYLAYNALDFLTFKGGISTGYKTPDVPQLISGVYGYSGGRGMSILRYGNPNLKPESSISFELSALSETDYTDAGITGFYNLFSDKINSAGTVKSGEAFLDTVCSNAGGCEYSINVDRAKTYGTEVFFQLKPLSIGFGDIGLNLNYTWTKSLVTAGASKGIPLANIPEHNFNGTINYSIDKFGLYFRSEFKANQLNIQGRTNTLATLEKFYKNNPNMGKYYKPYFLLHLGGHYDITKRMRLSVAIYNLLNHSFVDYEYSNTDKKWYNSYAYIQEGRRYYISLNMDF